MANANQRSVHTYFIWKVIILIKWGDNFLHKVFFWVVLIESHVFFFIKGNPETYYVEITCKVMKLFFFEKAIGSKV